MSDPCAFEFIFFCEELFLHSNYSGKIHIWHQGNYSAETHSPLMKITTCDSVTFNWSTYILSILRTFLRTLPKSDYKSVLYVISSGIPLSHMKLSVSSWNPTKTEMHGLAEVTAWMVLWPWELIHSSFLTLEVKIIVLPVSIKGDFWKTSIRALSE